MLSDKEVKEINPRLLCRMASQTDRSSNLQHDIEMRTSSQPGESKFGTCVGQQDVYIQNERSFLDGGIRADGSQEA